MALWIISIRFTKSSIRHYNYHDLMFNNYLLCTIVELMVELTFIILYITFMVKFQQHL